MFVVGLVGSSQEGLSNLGFWDFEVSRLGFLIPRAQ